MAIYNQPVHNFHTLVAGRWLEVSIRKVLRPATSAQVFLGFPVSIGEC